MVNGVERLCTARDLYKSYGDNGVSFQAIRPGYDFFFHSSEVVIPYQRAGRVLVGAGPPIGPRVLWDESVEAFRSFARTQRAKVCFFAVSEHLASAVDGRSICIGEEPFLDVSRWDENYVSSRSLREQLRRSRAKGLITQIYTGSQVANSAALRREVASLAARWAEKKPLPPLGFLVNLDLFENAREKVFITASVHGRVCGVLVAAALPGSHDLFAEHVLRDEQAPNGTAESLIAALMSYAKRQAFGRVSLGLCPLAGSTPRWLQGLGGQFSSLYSFAGLADFRRRLRPHSWERRFLVHPDHRVSAFALLQAVPVFAPGGLGRFAFGTLGRQFRQRNQSILSA